MKRYFMLFISVLIWPGFLLAAPPIFITNIKTTATPSMTRVTFTLTKKTYGRVKSFSNPGRIEIEFANTYLREIFKPKQFAEANIKKMYQVKMKPGSLKFIFILGGNVRWTTHYVPGEVPGLVRLQLDMPTEINKKQQKANLQKIFKQEVNDTFHLISKEKISKPVIIKSEIPKKAIIVNDKITEKPIALNESKSTRPIIIVLDAGHGGKDPGASGNRGAKEKDIVLRIARMLAIEINKHPNWRAVLTRDGDYFVPLRKRLRLARRDKADLFIAIHADAHYNRDAKGSSVYVLSQHGASSEAARWLANRENHAELGMVSLNQLVDTDPILRSVIVDLAQTATINSSIRLGRRVLDALDDFAKLHHDDVERAPFVVLKSPDIPSILLETGFITNSHEEKRLQNPAYQRQLVRAVRLGIENYLRSS